MTSGKALDLRPLPGPFIAIVLLLTSKEVSSGNVMDLRPAAAALSLNLRLVTASSVGVRDSRRHG